MKSLRYFFFPSSEVSLRRQMLPFFVLGVIALVGLVTVPPVWEYTNTAAFCGTTCHTMPPEYATYQISPHARVPCVDCHIGRDWILVQASRKVGHIRLVAATVLEDYEYPIRAGEMHPARDTCEMCHSPEKFSDDSLRVVHRYENNRENSPYDLYLLMHTGGGSEREGLGQGIHWHIENEVEYIATDGTANGQEIPWISVKTSDGEVVEYSSINSPIDTANLDQYEIHEMECTTCHNRIAHLIDTPDRLVDSALYQGDVSREIPFIRTRAIELLSAKYVSLDEANRAFSTLEGYYRDNYPDFYEEGRDSVQQAIAKLVLIYEESNYPEQSLFWTTHPNNIGHTDSPGCFRCHDGQHFSEAGEAIRLECNLCHSIPQVVGLDEIEPMIPLTTGIEPVSHLDSAWIARHHGVFDATCSNCHTTGNPGGTDDSSFCSNGACHGTEWRFAGFDAPGLAATLGIYQFEPEPLLKEFDGEPTYQILQPLFMQKCSGCHGAIPSKGLRLTDYASLLAGGEGGVVVVPGAPEDSRMVEVLVDGHFAQFTDHQMDLLNQWIADNAPEE
jgi:nitrate/TMAO reductase-like tetraheme cytochrome c subunit